MKDVKMSLSIEFIGVMLFLLAGMVSSCKKDKGQVALGTMEVKITASVAQFADVSANQTTADHLTTSRQANAAQRRRLPIDKDFDLTVTWSPVTTQVTKAESMVSGKKARTISDMKPNTQYKLLVYDATGHYVAERDYTRGLESNTAALLLHGGATYKFVAYSINSTSANAAVNFQDDNNKTLDGTSISSLEGTADFMYFRKDMLISSSGDNYLNIVFVHQFSEITTTVDASATGKSIKELEAAFDSHYPNASIALSDGTITRIGTAGNLAVGFTGFNTASVTGINILNGQSTTATLPFSKLTIGTLTRTDMPPITNLNITPGVAYRLNLTIEPRDGNLVYLGQYATKIGDQIWMRHNLGADTSLNPDQNPSSAALLGNYYQYGRAAVVATSSTGSGAISGWNTSVAADNAWNSGTEASPTKTAADPCPNGYRVPTAQEYQHLIDNSSASNIGTWANNSTANTVGAAKVMTSKTDPNVKLTFPAAGYRNAAQGILYWRGGNGAYWTSSVSGSNLTRFSALQNSASIDQSNNSQPANLSKATGMTIRCIAIQK